jgi:hypothetical protein
MTPAIKRKVFVMCWEDKDVVLLIILPTAETVTMDNNVKKSNLVLNCNTMGGVDRADQDLKDYILFRGRRVRIVMTFNFIRVAL